MTVQQANGRAWMGPVMSALIGALVSLVIAGMLVQNRLGETATEEDVARLEARVLELELTVARNTERIQALVERLIRSGLP